MLLQLSHIAIYVCGRPLHTLELAKLISIRSGFSLWDRIVHEHWDMTGVQHKAMRNATKLDGCGLGVVNSHI